MNIVLKNDQLTVTLRDKGAETVSVRRAGCEYIWQGDPAYWQGQAPLLFPICGRLFGGEYTYRGKTYRMNLHGFARASVFEAEQIDDTHAVFTLRADDETRAIYPFEFTLKVAYTLDGDSLRTEMTAFNGGTEVMPAAFGGHPGFNVPLDGNGNFEDWCLEFSSPCSPDELLFSDTCFNTGKKRAFPLKDGKILPLRHSLFNVDAVFLSRICDTVTLKSAKSERSVTLNYPRMPYLGIWHKPRTDAPYVCVEPWCGLPSFDGVTDDFSEKNDLFRIEPGKSETVAFTVSFR